MSLATLITDAVGVWKHRTTGDTTQTGQCPDVIDAPPDTRRLIRDRRYCRVLSNGNEMPFDDVSLACAWRVLEHEMALVPAGEICLQNDVFIATPGGFETAKTANEMLEVESLFLDRDCVTNADYEKFVQSGGYTNPGHWPEAILPNVLQFVDSTGVPGPRFWSEGRPPADMLDHPVVGICWYEANAYATWVGKRLPTSEEWQRAGTWPMGHTGDATNQRYPWGDAFDPRKANTWDSGIRDTVAVAALTAGSTPNGVRQLIGNVWEWVDAQFHPNAETGVSVTLDQTMAEIRGGAFDTYFHSQATCQFRTGQPLLFRGPNVGFRCCVSGNTLTSPEDSQTLPTEQEYL